MLTRMLPPRQFGLQPKAPYRLPKTVNDTVNQAMAVSIASMRALKGQVKVLDKAIEQQFEIIRTL